MGKNEEALEDCLMAQKIDPKCLKAIIHQGRALQNLQRFDEAIKSFQRVQSIDKKQTKLVEGYVKEAKRLQEIHEKEKQTVLLESSGDVTTMKIKEIISKLRKEEISYACLSDILDELKNLIDKDIHKTIFRTNGGFRMLAENPAIKRLLKKDKCHSDTESKVLVRILNLLSKVCLETEENTKELLQPSIFSYLSNFISSNFTLDVRIATSCLVQIISQLEEGRNFLLQNGENECILHELLSLLTSNDEAATIAAGVITNLALFSGLSEESSKKICTKFVTFIKTIMEVFSSMDKGQLPSASVLLLVSQSITTVTNLARDPSVRTVLAVDSELWKFSARLIASYENHLGDENIEKLMFSLLGLLMNLSMVEKCTELEICQEINDACCRLLSCNSSTIVERSAGLLNHLLTSCSDLVQHNITQKNYINFLNIIKGQNEPAKRLLMKCIALCSSLEPAMANDVIQNKALNSLLKMLISDNDTVVGNSALTIGNLATDKNFSEKLASTNVVQDLLRIATNDDYKHAVKHNAAIAIGKLATSDPRHLERLRDLHGLEILHQVLKETQA